MDVGDRVFGDAVAITNVAVGAVLVAVLRHHVFARQDCSDFTDVSLGQLGVATHPWLGVASDLGHQHFDWSIRMNWFDLLLSLGAISG